MPLDPAANFVRDALQSGVADTDTTFSVSDAAQFPNPSTDGEFNVVVWDAPNNPRPDQDPDVEIVRVTAVDAGANELTVTRAQENTTAASHPVESGVLLAPTAKDTSDTVEALNARPESPVGVNDLADGLGTGAASRLGGTTYFNSHDSLAATEKVHNGVVFVGHPDFSTIQDAIDFADANGYSTVKAPTGSYAPTSFFRGLNLIGEGQPASVFGPGTTFDLQGTFSAGDVTISNFHLDANSTLELSGFDPKIRNGELEADVTISADNAIVTECFGRGQTIVLSGDNCVVDTNANLFVTDNGVDNVIGDNS